ELMANILSIIPYHHLAPPMNGGQLRCYRLLIEMAKNHDIHVITLQSAEELIKYLPESISIYSPDQYPTPKNIFDILPPKIFKALHYRWLRRSFKGPANDVLLKTHHLIKDILKHNKIDIVYFEHIASMLTAPLIKNLSSRAIKILDAHNIDHRLVELENKSRGINKYLKEYKRIKWHESNLSKFVDAYFVCSEEDKRILESLNPTIKGFVIPNGVDVKRRIIDDRSRHRKQLIFCGALNTIANKDGLLWFYNEVWPELKKYDKEVKLIIIGIGGEDKEYDLLKNDISIQFLGEVKNVIPYYYQSGISIVPLRIGSGTRIKILEAMSLGNPVVSTKIGAEGIPITHNKNIIIADTTMEFSEAILSLIKNYHKFDDIRFNAYKFVSSNYDWELIGSHVEKVLDILMKTSEIK
ncbi:MAG: glycosyltransferase, partial [Asgard group archaeon]|nr:glycosyltransferase [Asgard group archaeon]